jgi:hypothetical protein
MLAPPEFGGEAPLNTDLERKARRYRELARMVPDEALRAEIEKLASEYERAARLPSAAPRLDPAA